MGSNEDNQTFVKEIPQTVEYKRIVVNPVLTYVAHALDTSPIEHVNTCCVQFYSSEELNLASQMILNSIL